jgi:hypothetical protein
MSILSLVVRLALTATRLRPWIIFPPQHGVTLTIPIHLDEAEAIAASNRKPTHVQVAEAVADAVILKVKRRVLVAAVTVKQGAATAPSGGNS